MKSSTYLIIDVESIGLQGEAFAVAGGIVSQVELEWTFLYACDPDKADGLDEDREWVEENVPKLDYAYKNPKEVRDIFWEMWDTVKLKYPDVIMCGECIFPVETNFVSACVKDDLDSRMFKGPYPFHDISSIMLSAGMDPMEEYERLKDELPAHQPLCDVRQSARLLIEAIKKLPH